MKANIHPKYYPNCQVTCACGNTFTTGSTLPEIKVDICSACHPFFTGQMKYVDTMGRVEKFQASQRAAKERKYVRKSKRQTDNDSKTPQTLKEMIEQEKEKLKSRMPNDYLKTELDRLDKKIKLAQDSLSDPQLKPLAEEEIIKLTEQKKLITDSQNIPSRDGMLPSRDGIQGNIILEIRAGIGGEEAKIFAGDLTNMYTRFALSQKLEVTPLDENIIKIKGKKAYSLFQFEAGGHRVQRVPATESQGRIHTSTATVAVLPEVKETDIQLNPKDIEVHFFHASSHGGQNVQKVSTAVRLTHKPTGIISTCQSQRFQEQNRKIATDLLRAKLYQLEQEKIASQTAQARLGAGSGMRAEKIRTYNFPQNRVTDHRLKQSWKSLDQIIEGDLMPIIKTFTAQPLLPA